MKYIFLFLTSLLAIGQTQLFSGASSAATDTTPPSIPVSLFAAATSSSELSLTWTASTDDVGVTGYQIFRNGTQIASPTAPPYYDTGLAASTTYSYTVRALDAFGNKSALSTVASGTTLANGVTASFLRPATLPDLHPVAGTLRSAAAARGLYIGTTLDPTGDGF